ncbi:GAF domain-containing protein [Chryseolinea sp. T2]|uniref:GAF domain-containing protein n=1 Tax=Chryseolinea sp. T2 TaxID=3129255 RepID=UPI0030772306
MWTWREITMVPFLRKNVLFILGALIVPMLFFYLEINAALIITQALLLVLMLIKIWMIQRHVGRLRLATGSEGAGADEVLADAGRCIERCNRQLGEIALALRGLGHEESSLSGMSLEGEAGSAVVELHNKLVSIREDESRQNWIVKGIALVGEIRNHNSGNEDYADHILSTVIKYLSANQGAFYFKSGDNVELVSTYAYEKKRFVSENTNSDKGCGLVGQCMEERDFICLTDIPRNYVKITSGLGEATPRNVIIFPLIFREEVYGAIELASFQIFERHHLEFLRRISVRIASELAGILQQQQMSLLLQQARERASESV